MPKPPTSPTALIAVSLLTLGVLGCQPARSPAPTPTASPQAASRPEPSATPPPLPPPLLEKLSEAAELLRSQDIRALAALEALEKDARTSAPLSEQLAGLYEELDFTDKLYALAKQATRLDPSYSPGFVRLGRVEQYLGYYTRAQKHLEEAVRLAPSSSDAHVALALLHKHLDHFAQAEKSLQAARAADPKEWRFCIIQNQVLLGQNKFDEALKVLEEAAQIAPDKGAIPLQQTVTLEQQANHALKKGDTERARMLRQKGVALAQKTVEKIPDFGPAWYHLGRLQLDLGELAAAQTAWERACALAPTYLAVRYQLAQLYRRRGDKTRATELLRSDTAPKAQTEAYQQLALGVAQTPENLTLRRQFARYCVAHKLVNRALFEWEQVLERKPMDPEANREVKVLRARRLRDMTQ